MFEILAFCCANGEAGRCVVTDVNVRVECKQIEIQIIWKNHQKTPTGCCKCKETGATLQRQLKEREHQSQWCFELFAVISVEFHESWWSTNFQWYCLGFFLPLFRIACVVWASNVVSTLILKALMPYWWHRSGAAAGDWKVKSRDYSCYTHSAVIHEDTIRLVQTIICPWGSQADWVHRPGVIGAVPSGIDYSLLIWSLFFFLSNATDRRVQRTITSLHTLFRSSRTRSH